MPPHTISPSPSSQGLGIYQSTLSPPPNNSGSQRFTGMVPRPQPPSPSRAYPMPSPTRGTSNTNGQPLFQARPSPSRAPSSLDGQTRYRSQQPSPPRAQPLFQPTFSLRPTHTRSSSSKGFTSFSAIPPSPSNRPVGPRPSSMISSPKLGGPSTRSDSGHSVDTIIPPVEEDTPKQPFTQLPVPSRSGSIVSNMTATSRLSRRAKSNEMLRKMSRGSDIFGVNSTSKYKPLSGEDEDEPLSTNVETSPAESLPFPRRPSSHGSRGVSTDSASPNKSSQQCFGPTANGSDESYSTFNARSFPLPPVHPPRSFTTYSDPTDDRQPPNNISQGMGRSLSQPLYLYSVPELNSELGRASGGRPRPESATMAKRSSDISSGVHSKNAVLLSAETGGMMLAFSPTGDGTWRAGEVICGSGTGLIPSPHSPPETALPHSAGSIEDEDLRTRPWSDSTMSQHMGRPPMLGHRGRSLSDGAQLLARQGTLLHPGSSNQRASAELGVLLGGPRSKRLSQSKLLPPPDVESNPELLWDKNAKVRLEASKKGKARVEVDVVLERECVVEGGEVRGRLEVRISGGKRGEGLRVGGGKVRVVGFEEISGASRHIFYHQPHTLPVFDPTIQHNLSSSLFASGPDSDGYRLASEGTHSIPFRMRLPLGGGAKGTYSSAGGKGPSVRYVVVGSIKIHIPSTGKRSIAHFYRSVVVLPYLNPSVVLAPSPDPVEAYVERGLGWSLTGEKGRVELRVSMGRRIWVSGQRLWCEVGIRNESNRKIKTLNIALLQTVQAFNSQPMLDTRDLPTRIVQKRKSLGNCTGSSAIPGTPDLDACQTSTQMRKICEEVTEADFASRGAGRVTGKGWWTGVEPGEQGHWDMSLQIPPGFLSIRRTRLLEVQYALRVTLNGSIYVDLPVQLINFLSIDPPPMPGDGLRSATVPSSQSIAAPGNMGVAADGQPYNQRRPEGVRNQSGFSLDSLVGPARASSTTLHIDALLQAGRARAEAEAQYAELQPLDLPVKPRPISIGSSYTLDRQEIPVPGVTRTKSTPTLRPKASRLMSYRSTQSDSQSVFSGLDEEDEDDEIDQALLAARRTQARQRSLAVIHHAMDKEARELLASEEAVHSPGGETPPEGQFQPWHTPSEETLKLGGDTPSSGLQGSRAETPLVPQDSAIQEGHEAVEEDDYNHEDELEDNVEHLTSQHERKREHDDIIEEHEDEMEHVGDQTILEDLVGEEREALEEVISLHEYEEGHKYDYGEEIESDYDHQKSEANDRDEQSEGEMYLPRSTSGRLPFVTLDRDQHIAQSRSINGSFAASAVSGVSEQESEVGQVYEAVKRNVSVRLPPRLLPLANANQHDVDNDNAETGQTLTVPRSGSVSHALLAQRRASHASETRRGSNASLGLKSYTLAPPVPPASNSRRGSVTPLPTGRRDSSVVKESSPLRSSITEESQAPTARVVQKKSSFSFATPGSPLKVKILPTDSTTNGPSEAIRRGLSPGLSPKSTHPNALEMTRGLSANSQLRNEVVVENQGDISPNPSHGSDEDHNPGLAPSVASDSASSEGYNPLESPPTYDLPHITTSPPPGISKRALPHVPAELGFGGAYQGFTDPSPKSMNNPSWMPSQDFLRTQVSFVHDPSARTRPSLSVSVKDGASSHHAPSIGEGHGRRGSILPIPSDEMSASSHHASPMGSPASSCHSILPSVKTKIAQLNSREEALRKFSVSGASITSPISPSNANTTPVSPASKRRSYTSALAPRPVRSSSDDQFDHIGAYSQGWKHDRSSTHSQPMSAGPSSTQGVGHTPYFPRRSFLPDHQRQSMYSDSSETGLSPRTMQAPRLDPFGLGFGSGILEEHDEISYSQKRGLERGLSNCSTSTTATDVERALNSRPSGIVNGPRAHVRSSTTGTGEKTLKAKVSGFWEGGDEGFTNGNSSTSMGMARTGSGMKTARDERVSLSEGTDESESLL